MSTVNFINETTDMGFGGTNQDINKRLDNTFNQWTRAHDDSCSYVNDMRILQKPIKYYTSQYWAPAPTNTSSDFGQFSTYTPIGNQKSYNVAGNLTYPGIGEPTSMRSRRFLEYTQPFLTSPNLGSNNVNTSTVDVESTRLGFGIGELTNMRNVKETTTSTDYNRWQFVDKNVVQNPEHIIFANGIIPVGGISSRNELRNYASINKF
jgi:hypothetical protein